APGAGAPAASVAAGHDRRAVAAMRLLLQWCDHQGRRAALAEPAPDRAADPRPHGRPSVPMRDLSARHEVDPARVHENGGSAEMSDILNDTTFSRRDLLKG